MQKIESRNPSDQSQLLSAAEKQIKFTSGYPSKLAHISKYLSLNNILL